MLTYHKVTGHKIGVIDTYANVKIRNNMELRFYDDGDNYVGFEAPALSANQIWVLPTADGSNTQVLRTDGSGTLSWASAAIGSGQVELDDTDASDQLIFDWSEASETDYTLDWKVNASNRTIDLGGNLTLAGNFVTQNNNVTINAVGAARTITLNESLTIGDGSDGTLTFSAGSKVLTVADNCTVNQNLRTTDDPTFDDLTVDKLQVQETIYNDAETTASPSAAFTVDWNNSNSQRVTITGANLDITFTDPPGPCRLVLVIVQGDGDDTIDWTNEASILFPGGVDPTLSTGNADIDVVTFYFDGTSYLALFNGNFG